MNIFIFFLEDEIVWRLNRVNNAYQSCSKAIAFYDIETILIILVTYTCTSEAAFYND